MTRLVIAVAQTSPVRGDIGRNLESHLIFVSTAAEHTADAIFFPELSLTGYEPELAEALAVYPTDNRLSPLIDLSLKHAMTIVTGAPIVNPEGKPFIGSLVVTPNGISTYLKQHLHQGEERYFASGTQSCVIEVTRSRIGLAICADIAVSKHVSDTAERGASIYAASVFITPKGHENDAKLLQGYAATHKMAVVMANYCGESGGMVASGKSAVWDEQGRLVVEAFAECEQLIVAAQDNDGWNGRVRSV